MGNVNIRWGSSIGEALSSSAGSTLLAGFGGAVVGGVVSYLLARQSSRETLRRDQDARLDLEHAAALRAMVTAMNLANRVYTLNGVLSEATGKAGADGPWTTLKPVPKQRHAAPRFEATDFVPFIKSGAADLVHRCSLLADRVDSLESSFEAYSTTRLEVEEMAAKSTTFDAAGMGNTVFSGEEAAIVRFKGRNMNLIIAEMADFAARDQADAIKIVDDMNAAFQRYFGKRSGFRLEAAVGGDTSGRDAEPAGNAEE